MLLHIGADHGKRSCLRAVRFGERFSLYFILPHAQQIEQLDRFEHTIAPLLIRRQDIQMLECCTAPGSGPQRCAAAGSRHTAANLCSVQRQPAEQPAQVAQALLRAARIHCNQNAGRRPVKSGCRYAVGIGQQQNFPGADGQCCAVFANQGY